MSNPIYPLRPGYKQTAFGAIPEEWEISTLSAMSKAPLQNGVFYKPSLKGTGVKLINVGDLYNRAPIDLNSLELFDATEKERERFGVGDGDLFFTRSSIVPSGIAYCNIYRNPELESVVFDSHVIRMRPDTRKIVPSYLFRYLVASVARRYLVANAKTGTMTTIDQKILGNCPVAVPTNTEQEAIAEALSDVDALIESQEQLLTKKRHLKQATTQELLTGKKRLPGFNGEWKERSIGELAEVGRGRVISHIEIAKSIDPKYPVFSSQTSNNGVMGYLDSFDFEGEYITWTTDGANAGTVFSRSGRFNCTNVCGTIKLHFGDHRLIAVALGRVSKAHVSRHLGNPKLMNDVMKRINIRIPSDIQEQAAIAAILADIDTELSDLEAQLARTRTIKQGMMQKLLTGEIRLI